MPVMPGLSLVAVHNSMAIILSLLSESNLQWYIYKL